MSFRLTMLFAVSGTCGLHAQELSSTASERPNVILIMTDDQGYGDIGAHGNSMIRTPNLDELAGQSVRLSDFHVDPTCSPTRSALLTGRDSTRTGVWHTIMGRSLMDTEEETLAEVFARGGYRTGMFGKWHLGDNYPLRPQDQGFEHVVWHRGGGVGQGPDYWDNDYFDDTYEVNGEYQKFEGYCTDVWFEQAAEFIEAEDDRPFFAYLATNAPHGPYLVPESNQEPYREAGVAPTMAKFYGMITNIDENLGRLRALLEARGLAENTILIFMTDNGTAAGRAPGRQEESTWQGFNAGMRGQKGSEYDGGHRVPFFLHWPAGGIDHGREISALSAHIDVLPTLVELCGLNRQGERPIDGASFARALLGKGAAPSGRTLFVHSQRIEHPEKWRKSAVMTDRWRLVNGAELYDMVGDPGQTNDVAGDNASVVAELRKVYDAWWESLVPAFDRYVRIGIGGSEDPVELMSHDWHTDDRAVPWHQNHVRNGLVADGMWALEVLRPGEYDFTLRRWPAHLKRPMDCVRAWIRVGPGGGTTVTETWADAATIRLNLSAGPTELRAFLQPRSGEEHGAYFVSVRRVDG